MMKHLKKKICVLLTAALVMAGVMTGCAFGGQKNGVKNTVSTAPSEPFDPHKFGMDDLTVNGNVKLGMTVDEVKEILGQPDSEETLTDEFIYGKNTLMTYGGLSLTFFDPDGGDDFRLGIISSTSENDKFVGGLHVGCSADEVIADFTRDEEVLPLYFDSVEESCGDYLYGTFTRDDFLLEKPEGVIQYAYINKWGMEDSGEYLLEYYYYNPLIWAGEYSGYTGDYYSMVFYVDAESNLVSGINLNYDVLL